MPASPSHQGVDSEFLNPGGTGWAESAAGDETGGVL